jgi:methyltransferase of ATP-grasp peptide maturase system
MTDSLETKLREQLADELMADGSIRTNAWHHAFVAVPRQLFLPALFRQTPDNSAWELVTREHPEQLGLIYRDQTWVTQLDGDETKTARAAKGDSVTGTPSSSSTAPGLMALMLEALELHGDERVLEIGTGTGYNAALLAERLGNNHVTTVDVDPSLTRQAEQALTRAGYAPTVITGDGRVGYAGNAPYDRVIATCAASTVPRAWIDQTRPSGLVLTNLFRDLGGGVLVRLTVSSSGSASGRILPDYGGFMSVRNQQQQSILDRFRDADHQAGECRLTTVSLGGHDEEPYAFLVALFMPGVQPFGFRPSEGRLQQWLFASDGSWACHRIESGTVEQYGERRLWDEIEAIRLLWLQLGQPTRDRFGLTVNSDGVHALWLDNPGSGKTWPLPTR